MNARRIPSQSRSREKYDKIIKSTRELIGQNGNDSVSMREISKHSGVALASIYQYFPDKAAILQAIMEDLFAQVRKTIKVLLTNCDSFEELTHRVNEGIDSFYSMFKKDPVIAILWSGLQAHPELVELDSNDSIQNAEIITETILLITLNNNKQSVFDATLLLLNIIGSTVKLAITLPEDEGNRLINELKTLVSLRINSLAQA